MDALPDAHFVGFAQAVNDFGISSGKFALARSANEIVCDYAARAVAEHATAVQSLSKSRADAGVSYDGKMGPVTANALTQLSALQGPEFDAAFANLQVAVQTAATNVPALGLYRSLGFQQLEQATCFRLPSEPGSSL